ncbi:hypothetical protein TD95_002515 [Thielaviopsis punctulata]|uniref:Autophagy-related protein 9 n=1 Tax=Thielaviopsis punctulata TaxID=72032 RepID=A0A0F4ZGF7_9PEZI|nr:hypothetical protein TD95_002515 [Thielaviopsis punctulata]
MDSNFFYSQGGVSHADQSFYERLRNPEGEASRLHSHHQPQGADEPLDDYNFDDNLRRLEESRVSVDDSTVGLMGGTQRRPATEDYDDNAVPASLLVEAHDDIPIKVGQSPPRKSKRKGKQRDHTSDAAKPGPIQNSTNNAGTAKRQNVARTINSVAYDPRERALWNWVNVTNLDSFMGEVYEYFNGNGMWCTLFDRALHIVETAFIAIFLTFLTQCVSYSNIPKSTTLKEIVVPKCTQKMSGIWNFGIWLYTFYFIWKCVQLFTDGRRLLDIRDFYTHLLNIPEDDMQTVSWQDIVARIMALRDSNPNTALNMLPGPAQFMGGQSKERLDAHDIANRLMRRDNYFIAMINKDILNMSFPVPFLGRVQMLSRTLEWYLYYCIIDFVFDPRGQVHPDFLKANFRRILSEKLRQRFIFAAIISTILSPFVLAYAVIVYFFTYYNEYQRDPSKVGTRRYTPLAEWKLREFNELPHIFEDRLKMSYPFASRYLDQFPKKLSDRVFRTISFISGSLLAVLAIASLLDEVTFLGFEITPGRTVFFYLGILGVVWKGARDSIQEETLVFNPDFAMQNVIEYTHYMPDSWEARLHSFEVKREFAAMYKMKLIVFLEELVGIITTPIVLWASMPQCSEQIIDFFREFTIYVDGLGYVCSFAVFDFKKGVGRSKSAHNTTKDVREGYYATKHNKMAASYYGFLDNYVINPKTGMPHHLPLSGHPSHHGEEMLTGPRDFMEHGRDANTVRNRGLVNQLHAARAIRFAPNMQTHPSPMGSVLLDPHNQPSAIFSGRNVHQARPKASKAVNFGVAAGPSTSTATTTETGGANTSTNANTFVSEESNKKLPNASGLGAINSSSDEEAGSDNDNGLDESVWQTSAGRASAGKDKSTGSGSSSRVAPGGEDAGVLGMIYQFQQAHRNHRPGAAGGVL